MAKSVPIPQFGLAIDWETSGYSIPNYAEKHQGLSFGAVVFDTKALTPVEELYCEIKYKDKYTWDDGAAAIHGLTKPHLAAHGVEQEEAAMLLGQLVLKYFGDTKIMMLGHRVHFDLAFTDQLMQTIELKFEYDPIKLDSASFAVLFLEVQKSDELFDLMGLPPRAAHNSLEDIVYTLESLRRLKEFFVRGLEHS